MLIVVLLAIARCLKLVSVVIGPGPLSPVAVTTKVLS